VSAPKSEHHDRHISELKEELERGGLTYSERASLEEMLAVMEGRDAFFEEIPEEWHDAHELFWAGYLAFMAKKIVDRLAPKSAIEILIDRACGNKEERP